eukprot:scaffold94091_cov63-Phaeocystis_antarctica.AAC.2
MCGVLVLRTDTPVACSLRYVGVGQVGGTPGSFHGSPYNQRLDAGRHARKYFRLILTKKVLWPQRPNPSLNQRHARSGQLGGAAGSLTVLRCHFV